MVQESNDLQFQAKNIPLSKIIDYLSGNSGLTDEYLYSQLQSNFERKYLILTGSIDYGIKRYIHRCKHPKNSTKLINVIEEKPIIHVVRKGKAGSIKYFETGNYTINDDAYLFYLREDNPYQVSLKWLSYMLRPKCLEYSSSSENGTFNKTGFFKYVTINIPFYDEQMVVVKEYERLEKIEEKINNLSLITKQLLSRQISTKLSQAKSYE